MTLEVLIELCANSTSLEGVHCFASLDKQYHRRFGSALCGALNHANQADNTNLTILGYPSECFNILNKLHVNEAQVTEQCLQQRHSRSYASCVETSTKYGLTSLNKAMIYCSNTTSPFNESSVCISSLMSLNILSLGVKGEDIIEFCAGSEIIDQYNKLDYSPAAHCFFESLVMVKVGNQYLSMNDRFRLCKGAKVKQSSDEPGPLACFKYLMPLSKLYPTSFMIDVCQEALDAGPAHCLDSFTSAIDKIRKVELCKGGSKGRALCLIDAIKSLSDSQALELCSNSLSRAPVLCFSQAPIYLSIEEKIALCRQSSEESAPSVSCLKAAQSSYRLYHDAPIRSLGYPFLESSFNSTTNIPYSLTRSRSLMITMCSAASSNATVSPHECFQHFSNRIYGVQMNDALRFCSRTQIHLGHADYCLTNIADMIRLGSNLSAIQDVCLASNSKTHANALINCARSSYRNLQSVISTAIGQHRASNSLGQVIEIMCGREDSLGSSLSCLNEAFTPPLTDVNYDMILNIAYNCREAPKNSQRSKDIGKCLSKITFSPNYRLLRETLEPFLYSDPDSRALCNQICLLSDRPNSLLQCLDKLSTSSLFVQKSHVLECANTSPIPNSVEIIGAFNHDPTANNIKRITAGSRFHLIVRVLDQWGQPYIPKNVSSGLTYSVNINHDNPQGAVLWGLTMNKSDDKGIVEFNFLSISLPGSVSMKVQSAVKSSEKRVIGIIRIDVDDDPARAREFAITNFCINYVFSRLTCSKHDTAERSQALYPRFRGSLPSSNTIDTIVAASCQSYLDLWNVSLHLSPSGYVDCEYRVGIDAILMNTNPFPTEQTSFEDRLGLADLKEYQIWKHIPNENATTALTKKVLKEIRRRYYQLSLIWHPDRWVNMPKYKLITQGAFHLIVQAYEHISESITTAQGM